MALVRMWGMDQEIFELENADSSDEPVTSGGPVNNGRYWANSTFSANHAYFRVADAGSGIVEGGMCFWIKPTSDGSSYLGFYDDTTQMFRLAGKTDAIQVVVPGQTTVDIAATTGDWHYLWIEWKIDNTTGYLRIYRQSLGETSRTLVYENTGIDTDPGSTNGEINKLDAYRFSGTHAYDDFVLWDTTGTGLNSAPTEILVIQTIVPNGDGAETDFVESTGTTSWDLLDETLNATGDADYVSSTTTGDRTRLDVETPTIPSTATIIGVQAVASCRTTSSGNMKVGVRGPSGSESLSGSVAAATSYAGHYHVAELNPDDSAAWEVSDLTNLQLVLEHGT